MSCASLIGRLINPRQIEIDAVIQQLQGFRQRQIFPCGLILKIPILELVPQPCLQCRMILELFRIAIALGKL